VSEAAPSRSPWLVSARWDVAVFGGSAAAAFALLVLGRATGALDAALPTWAWVGTVVFVDVAHVWATAWRVYVDPEEVERRPGLYLGVPVACWVGGVLVYTYSSGLFWRALAYVAVFHFVRQQYGWVALYRRKLGVISRRDRLLDDAAIYSATLYPLVWWHAHLPREFEWFLSGDFLPGLPPWVAHALLPVHLALTAAWALRQGWLVATGRAVSPGKILVVTTTWLTWWVGIVALDSDYAFTVTNVLVHGVPYLAFVHHWGRQRYRGSGLAAARVFRPGAWPLYLAPLLLAAWLEEWGWDLLVWHERAHLFPGPHPAVRPEVLALLVPLLAVPQATHYVLDAWIWRTRVGNPGLARRLGLEGDPAPG
jgi:hypothetical protein